MRRLLLLLFIIANLYSVGQGTSMTLLFEPLESSNDMMWVTQRFELVKDYTKTNTSITAGLETQSAVFGNYGGFYASDLREACINTFAHGYLLMWVDL